MKDAKWVYEFSLEDAQKAYNLLAMHHSELLNMNHDLQKQLEERLEERSVTKLLMWKIKRLFKRYGE
jgi:hypothetical protein